MKKESISLYVYTYLANKAGSDSDSVNHLSCVRLWTKIRNQKGEIYILYFLVSSQHTLVLH